MQGLKLFAGNRLETLVRTLSDHLSEPLTSPLAREVIVVQSKGMEHWLSMQLASRHGVCSNCSFPFPHTMMNLLFGQVLGELPGTSAFEPESMAWRIMAVLPGLLGSPGFETLQSYLADDLTGVKLYQLSDCLADIFDTYLVFRPGMILGWQSGTLSMPASARPLETWQCALWRAVSEGHGHEHPAALRERFLASLGPAAIPKLPERISLFGISSLPPFYLEVFHALSRFIPVSFYLLNPCREYWGDIRSRSEMARESLVRRETVRDLHLEEGNGLLATLGAVGRDLFDILQEYEAQEFDAFEDVEPDTLLKSVQRDILELASPGPEDGRVVGKGDLSIQIHSCHSPMREVEALRDALLALFDQDPGLRPEEVLVMSPDIELYAPFIQAVFDVPRKEPGFLPFAIVDRSLKASNTVADVLMALLDMSTSRFEASRVLELLESEPLRRRFGLAEGDIGLIERWVRETGIRWGIDASWKGENGLPAYPANTWDFGLDRMLLGYAMASEGGPGFAGVLPYDDIEGEGSLVLGSFLSFLGCLFERARDLGRARTLKEWSALLAGLLGEFFAVDEEAVPQVSGLRTLFRGLGDMEDRTGMTRPLRLDVIRAYLKTRIGAVAEGRNFLSGGMTFCAMLPMRSVPFKVVCLLGMNHDAFPRHRRAQGFDLIGHQPRRGDCNQRNKDLYLFLEALLSARSVFYASYLGQNLQDNSPIPPSVALSTLLEHVEGAYRDGEGGSVEGRLLTRHCLQAFNPRYFTGTGPLFSYSRENAHGARVLLQPGRTERVFLAGRLAEPGDEWRVVDVGTLCSFFRDPAKFLLKRRLKMAMPERPPFMEDFEPVEVADLERYRLMKQHVERLLAGMGPEESFGLMRMGGFLPHGLQGEIVLAEIHEESCRMVRAITRCTGGEQPAGRLVETRLGPFALTGSVRVYPGDRAVLYRPAKMKGFDLMSAWIHHLALCCTGEGVEARTWCIARDETREYRRPENCREILAALLETYWQGLTQPLPFFPETSWEYARALVEGKSPSADAAIEKAREFWDNPRGGKNESRSFSRSVCFPGADPLDERFRSMAEGLYGPLLRHGRKDRP